MMPKEREICICGGIWRNVSCERWEISVIIKYVPVFHSPDMLIENKRIEHNPGLDEGTMITMRWIKPI